MHNFKKLKVWVESMSLVSKSYQITKSFPEFEKFGLVSQMNRSAVSIPSNIAEGSSKSSDKHFNKFLEVSLGLAFEWETQLIIAFNENYISDSTFSELENQIKQTQKMISRFQTGLK
jgi:four helix bundle protein